MVEMVEHIGNSIYSKSCEGSGTIIESIRKWRLGVEVEGVEQDPLVIKKRQRYLKLKRVIKCFYFNMLYTR